MSDQEIHHTNPEEIDLWVILQKLWARRGLLIILPLMFSFLAVIWLLVTAVETSTPTVYYVELQGIEKSRYPNGTVFSPQDMLIPDALDVAVTSVGIPNNASLRAAINSPTDNDVATVFVFGRIAIDPGDNRR